MWYRYLSNLNIIKYFSLVVFLYILVMYWFTNPKNPVFSRFYHVSNNGRLIPDVSKDINTLCYNYVV